MMVQLTIVNLFSFVLFKGTAAISRYTHAHTHTHARTHTLFDLAANPDSLLYKMVYMVLGV